MWKIYPIILVIIFGLTTHKLVFASAQTTTEPQQLITKLNDPATSDEASLQLKALAGSNADARRYLVKELPNLISKTSQDPSQYKAWINSVQLAGELKIEETIPVLVSLFDPVRYSRSAVSTISSRARLDDDPIAKALVRVGEPAIGPVSGILEGKDRAQHTRLRAALVLYNMNSPAADAALAHDLQTESDPRVRSYIEERLKGHQKTNIH